MVKAFLCETTKDCISRLQILMQKIQDVCVLFPSAHFYDLFVKFCPQIDAKRLFTPSKLLHELNEESFTEEIAYLFNEYEGSVDPNLFLLNPEFHGNLSNYENIGFLSENFFKRKASSPYKNCILYGPFPPQLLKAFVERLGKIFSSIFIIKRNFKEDLLKLSENIKSYHVENITEEKLWVQKRLEKEDQIPFVAYDTKEFSALFDKRYDPVKLNGLAWQELGTLGSFLIYLRSITKDNALFESYKKDLMEAYKQCLVDDFTLLQQYLLEHDKSWIKTFKRWQFPQKANVNEYIQIFRQTELAPIIPEKAYEMLANCLLPYSKNQFFAYLRKILKKYSNASKENILSWAEAIYLPIKDCYYIHAISDEQYTTKQLVWLSEIEKAGGKMEVCASLMDEKGMRQTPLLSANNYEKFFDEFSHGKFTVAKRLTLPQERVKFSCKAWERFYLCPRRTWVDAVLKAEPISLDNHCLKTKIFGEWVHDNLQFEFPPKTLKDWHENIEKNSAARWDKIRELLKDRIPYVFSQWHLRALRLSHKMAQSCEDLFNEDWQLFSEYSLPKSAEYTGRIDLLAIKGKQAIIIDYKTAAHYTFTKQQIGKGHGLQLLLYGRQLQKIYDEIILRVIDKNGNNLTLNLSDISESVKDLELWMKTFISTGLYESLPQENANTLPLCWPQNI